MIVRDAWNAWNACVSHNIPIHVNFGLSESLFFMRIEKLFDVLPTLAHLFVFHLDAGVRAYVCVCVFATISCDIVDTVR